MDASKKVWSVVVAVAAVVDASKNVWSVVVAVAVVVAGVVATARLEVAAVVLSPFTGLPRQF